MPGLTPEARARESIDAQLSAAGWALQDLSELNLFAGRGIAVRAVRSKGGPADYILFVDGKALGILEAKKEGETLSHVIKNDVVINGAFATDDQTACLDAWQSVGSDEGVPLAVAKRAFGQDPKPLIEQLNAVLVA